MSFMGVQSGRRQCVGDLGGDGGWDVSGCGKWKLSVGARSSGCWWVCRVDGCVKWWGHSVGGGGVCVQWGMSVCG